MTDLLTRIIEWLDASEYRTLTFHSWQDDMHGMYYEMEYSILGGEIHTVTGATREECFEKILEATK